MERYKIAVWWYDDRYNVIHINSKKRAEMLIYALIDRKYAGEARIDKIYLYDTKLDKIIMEEK